MAEDFSDRTQTFSIETPQKLDMQQVLVQVYDALKEKGYNPISQIVGEDVDYEVSRTFAVVTVAYFIDLRSP